jgi:ABC-type antimicrobial peptide transport system permease subunit
MGALVIEGFILSALGSVAGIVMGVAGSRLLSPRHRALYRRQPDAGTDATTAVAAIILGILGSLYPAIVATRASPAKALERA